MFLLVCVHSFVPLLRASSFYQGDNFGAIQFGFACSGDPLVVSGNKTLSSCRMLCTESTGCNAISWSTKTGHCRLYSTCNVTVELNFVTASRIQVVSDYRMSASNAVCGNRGNILRGKHSLEFCRDECERQRACTSFLYGRGPAKGSCSLVTHLANLSMFSSYDCYTPGESNTAYVHKMRTLSYIYKAYNIITLQNRLYP